MNTALSVQHVVKRFGDYTASNDVSFDILAGSVFGLLGPNGAGKTTLIRMITRIMLPDSGEILLNGNAMSDIHTQQLGYMPEERGLYKQMRVEEQLIYLARLKGLSKSDARESVKQWADKLGASGWLKKNTEELSKGMGQMVQFISTVAHNPSLIILDEPFSGLDPINSRIIEDQIRELAALGKTIIFSTHRLEQVEEFCKDIVLINKGHNILSGKIADLKQQFKENLFHISFSGGCSSELLQSLEVISQSADALTIKLKQGQSGNAVLQHFIQHQVPVTSFQEILPSLNDIFIRTVKQTNQH